MEEGDLLKHVFVKIDVSQSLRLGMGGNRIEYDLYEESYWSNQNKNKLYAVHPHHTSESTLRVNIKGVHVYVNFPFL